MGNHGRGIAEGTPLVNQGEWRGGMGRKKWHTVWTEWMFRNLQNHVCFHSFTFSFRSPLLHVDGLWWTRMCCLRYMTWYCHLLRSHFLCEVFYATIAGGWCCSSSSRAACSISLVPTMILPTKKSFTVLNYLHTYITVLSWMCRWVLSYTWEW